MGENSSTTNCIQDLTGVVDGYRARGAINAILVAALSQVAITTAINDTETAQMNLDALAAITKAAADTHRGKTVMNMAKAIFETP